MFDDAGYLIAKTETATGDVTEFEYDVFGNLRVVALPDGRVVEYEIDARNRRVGKKVDGAVEYRLLYKDQLEPVAMLGATNNVIATFVYGTRAHVPDLMVAGGLAYQYVTDHLGTVRMVVDAVTGAVAQRLDYDEFGVVLSDTNPGFQPFGFAGGVYDVDTGLVRFGARDYDAVTGRWTARDPILFRGGQTNLYAYCDGEPINRLDTTGFGFWDWLGRFWDWLTRAKKAADTAEKYDAYREMYKAGQDACEAANDECLNHPETCSDEDWVRAMERQKEAAGDLSETVLEHADTLVGDAKPR